jgi:hypothetical protein
MNLEKIFELEVKAYVPIYNYENFGEEYELSVTKFAELIILECSYLADQAHHKATGGKSAGGYIREQFGVEE